MVGKTNGRRAAEKFEISFHGSATFLKICQHGIFKRYIFSGYNRRDLVVHFHSFVELLPTGVLQNSI